jgi:ATP synthase protein I
MADNRSNPRPEALDDLSARVARARQEQQAAAQPGPAANHGMAVGWNMASVFVASVIVGALFGFGADRLFGSQPWGLFAGLMFGFAAGVVSLLRMAKAMSQGVPLGQSLPPEADGENDR